MKTLRIIAPALLATGLSACGLWQEDDIPIASVPDAAINGAKAAVEGFEPRSAESKERDSQIVYEIDGKANGSKIEVLVAADGEVIKVKSED